MPESLHVRRNNSNSSIWQLLRLSSNRIDRTSNESKNSSKGLSQESLNMIQVRQRVRHRWVKSVAFMDVNQLLTSTWSWTQLWWSISTSWTCKWEYSCPRTSMLSHIIAGSSLEKTTFSPRMFHSLSRTRWCSWSQPILLVEGSMTRSGRALMFC